MPRTYLSLFSVLFFLPVSGLAEISMSPSEREFFEKEIRPVLIERCYQCHSADHKIKGGLRLDTATGVSQGGDSGAALVKGEPDESLLITAIRYHDRSLQMPPKNRLPEKEIAALEKWIAMGAADPREDEAGGAVEPDGMSLEEGRRFWSFRPVQSPEIPDVSDAKKLRTPIDHFIFAKLEENELSVAPPADKRTLIRRVTQNLIGLPATPEEIEAFENDNSDEAFKKVVDRLLASPHYGVRWGRHWLDVARYADSNGLDENLGFGQAWRYRDYVIDAFNSDKPFDQFIIEQLAGDLLPDASPDTICGTAFLQLGPKVLAEPNREKLDMDVIDEQLDTMGKAFLGMTFGCVRCHDHKFDPVSHADYYSLAAIFKGTMTLHEKGKGIKKWYEHSLVSADEEKSFQEIEKQIAAYRKAATDFKNKAIAKLRTEARAKAADYLVAASRFDTMASLSEVSVIAESLELHPRILHHARMHLEFHRDDPFFARWFDYNKAGDENGIRQHYGSLFTQVEDAAKKNPKVKELTDPILETARLVIFDNSGLLAVPTVEAFAFDRETLAEYHDLLDKHRAFEISAPDQPSLMAVCDGEPVQDLAIHIRGSHENLGEKVPRAFPAVMQWSDDKGVFPESSSGRLELAQWITDPRHPLTARVIVNRVWAWHFGAGLVSTTENFGVMGDRPSHPELLDWLATYFINQGWSVKKLNRLILDSYVYQQAGRHPDGEAFKLVDPENRWLWKSNLRRLEAEQIRDSILAVSDRLDLEMGGKTLPLRNRQFVFNHTSEDHTEYNSLRRAVYLPVIRNHLYSWYEQFDYPDPTMPTGVWNETVIAPQALVMMNDSLVMDSAEALAYRIIGASPDERERVGAVYEQILGREPQSRETERVIAFLDDQKGWQPEAKVWALVCQSLLISNEFFYLQ